MIRSNQFKILLPLIALTTLSSPTIVLAGAGHDHSGASSFKSGGEASGSVTVDAQTIKRLGIQIEPVKNQRLEDIWKYGEYKIIKQVCVA